MATDSPFVIRVYNKDLQEQGVIGAPIALSGSVLRNKPGSFQISIANDDPMVDDVLAKGARVGIDYRGVPLFSGQARARSGSITADGYLQFSVQGDRRLLDNTVALIAPGQPITPTSLDGTTPAGLAQAWQSPGVTPGPAGTIQGQYEFTLWPTNSTVTGSAEAMVKWLLQTNLVDRLRRPVVVAPDQARGGVVPLPSLRNPSLAEAVQPILEASGLVLSAIQLPGDEFVTIDVRVPDVWPAPLTSASGIVDGGAWSITPPTATRAIVGGPGQGAARAFFEVRDATGLEDEYGDVIEVFRDATGANLKWPDSLAEQYRVAKYFLLRPEVTETDKALFRAYVATAGNDALLDGQPVTSVNANLAETDQFYYGGTDGIQLGDRVRVTTEGGLELEDVVTEGEFSYTASGGVKVSPILGNRKDDPSRRISDAIVRLAAGQRKIQRDR